MNKRQTIVSLSSFFFLYYFILRQLTVKIPLCAVVKRFHLMQIIFLINYMNRYRGNAL